MKVNLSKEERAQFINIVDALGESLDITETQYNNLVTSYNAVGKYLESDPFFALYRPIVTPQGSLRLGTIIQPVSEDDDLDVDLVYRINGKDPSWTQKHIKDKVGNRLIYSDRYSSMLQEKEGRRCWTLLYRDSSDNPKEKYHMDILPAVTDDKYEVRVKRMFLSNFSIDNANNSAIRITDKKSEIFDKSTITYEWLRSNPDGYAFWFASRCRIAENREKFLVENVIPINRYNKKKYPLQRIVQILKRHRDWMFANDSEDKPISIIITTLAAQAYSGENNVLEGLLNVVQKMEDCIDIDNRTGVCKILNPVDPSENFADKWVEKPKKKENFFKWINKVKADVESIINAKGTSWQTLLGESFGKSVSQRTSNLYAEKMKKAITTGSVMVGSTGMMGAVGKVINGANTFFGNED
ncbi:MAG: nucleotidyltransferase [Bacteroides sp.]|jgi:hypothetical protein|nr:nucleotidyltransferase [Bacteroides sp.]